MCAASVIFKYLPKVNNVEQKFAQSGHPAENLTRRHLRYMCMYNRPLKQGCQMVYFQTKIPIRVNFGGP
jgi:hypothetical protein